VIWAALPDPRVLFSRPGSPRTKKEWRPGRPQRTLIFF
jgi:hypothetical protein